MLQDNYEQTFAMVYYYNYSSDPWMNARLNFYHVSGVPAVWFDGVIPRVGVYGNVQQTYNWYAGTYNTRRGVPTDVTIQLSGEYVAGQTYRIYGEVCIEPDGQAKTMRVYMIQVLDHWPSDVSYFRNVFKEAAATEDITLSPGDCQTVQRDFTFDADSWNQQDDIAILAWCRCPAAAARRRSTRGPSCAGRSVSRPTSPSSRRA